MPDYFTLAELNALPNMGEGRYTDPRKEAAAAYIVGIIERAVGTSFVARTVTDERHDGGVTGLALRKRYVLADGPVTATENGVAVTDTLRVSAAGVLYRFASSTATSPSTWARGVQNITVTYSAGYSTEPPPDIKEAALLATRFRLLSSAANSDSDARRTSITNEMGGTVNFAVAGVERPTGYPEVDAVILGWKADLNTVTYP